MAASPTLRRRQLARELSRLRSASGLTIEQAAGEVGISMSHLSRVERALVGVRLPVVKGLTAAYRADPDIAKHLFQLTKEAAQRGWWHRYGGSLPTGYATYIGFESDARQISSFDTSIIPGLVQTEAYAREIFKTSNPPLTADEINRRVEIRLRRQTILDRADPPCLWIILDEAAVRRRVGGPEVFPAQLEHLIELAERPHIDFQIVPFSVGAHSGTAGSFVILQFDDPTDPPVIYLETRAGEIFPEEHDDLNRITMAYGQLKAVGLSPADSVTLLRRVMKELSDE